MIEDYDYLEYNSKHSRNQEVRLRRTTLALVGALIHTIICVLLFYNGYFRMDLADFIVMFSLFWCVHLSFPILILMNINMKFKDPSLTLWQILWGIFCVMITLYFTEKMRPILMMFLLLDISFGAFQLERRQFMVVIFFVLVGYLCMIGLVELFHPLEASFREENIVFSSLAFITLILAFLSFEVGALRKHLQKKATNLTSHLEIAKTASYTDELTGLKNRRFGMGFLEQQRWFAERQNDYVFAVSILDLDHFKRVNDTFGHAAGDRVLKKVCEVILKELRKTDLIARLGGEEFLIILPFANVEHTKSMSERIRSVIEDIDFNDIAQDLVITVSIGYTSYKHPEEIEETLKRADRALYLAKSQGRNDTIGL